MRRWFVAAVMVLGLGAPLAAGSLDGVSVEPSFFNPTLGQEVTIHVKVSESGMFAASIVDRDGYVVRRFAERPVEPGRLEVLWDGRDDEGEIIPDEAYSLRLVLRNEGGRDTYDPAAGFQPGSEAVPPPIYSRATGTLSYELSRPSRVHIQAGQARIDPASGAVDGPVLKTLVDRQPRVGGRVIEQWNGLDESGTIRVPDLPGFAVSIAATPLPESSLISIGNRRRSFLDYIRERRSEAALAPRRLRKGSHRHHTGLRSIEDRSPSLSLEAPGSPDARKRVHVASGPLALRIALDPGQAAYFLAQPTALSVFVDDRRIFEKRNPANPVRMTVPARELPSGEHRLVVNWAGDSGPVAVNAIRVVKGSTARASRQGKTK